MLWNRCAYNKIFGEIENLFIERIKWWDHCISQTFCHWDKIPDRTT
jgi:hypothetical protein